MSDPREFLQEVEDAANTIPWITRTESKITGKITRSRLYLDQGFIDVYHNASTGSISYAYIENKERKFGANNMKVGWHVHPFNHENQHSSISPLSPKGFLKILQKELKKRGRI